MTRGDPGARIDALFRYPVKSMLGEKIETTRLDERGLIGDRAYALVDQETGKVASAKNPRRWGRLFGCRAVYVDEPDAAGELPPVRITLPDGATRTSDDARIHEWLSQFAGRPVRLDTTVPERPVIEVADMEVADIDPGTGATVDEGIAVVAPGTFFDAAPLHLVTTATLARLAQLAPGTAFPPARFRPNIVVRVAEEPGFVENTWVGRTLHLGTEARASVFLAAPRCVMTTLAQPDLPRAPEVLQTIARNNRLDIPGLGPSSCVGVYALIATAGAVHDGDCVGVV